MHLRKGSFQNVFPQMLALSVVSLTSLAGCGGGTTEQPQNASQNPSAQSQNPADQTKIGGTVKKSALEDVNPTPPPQYKTVVIDGVEMRQGRYPNGKFGGTLVRSIVASDPKCFNYWAAADSTSRELTALMFPGLVATDPYTGDVIPDMAESFTIAPDRLTYTTKLRKGLKWSDGKPITAEDVAFTWNTIVAGGYGNSSLRDYTSVGGKSPIVKVVDELTNEFKTPVPFAPFTRTLGIAIAPKHVIEPIIKKADGRKAFNELWSASVDPKTLVTSGPFVLKNFVPSQRVELARTKNYYGVNQEGKALPYLDRVVYLIVPDVSTNLLKFKNNEIDSTIVRARDVAELLPAQKQGNYTLYSLGESAGTTFVMFNLNRRKDPKSGKPYVDPIKSAWFNDVNFRQAVNHVINRSNMVANYFKGIGFTAFSSEPKSSPFFNDQLAAFKPDESFSMSLLEKSGFKKNAQGNLVDKDGHRVEFTLISSSGGTFYEAIGNMIVDDLKKLGIKANFQMINFNILADKINNTLNWDAALFSLTGDPLEPHGGANVFRSDARLHLFDQRLPAENAKDGKPVVTDARPWETELDELFDKGATTFDKAKRKEIYGQVQKIIYDQAPFIYTANSRVIVGARNTLKNFDPTALSQDVQGLHNLDEIWKEGK